jgi:hypothetical protein
MLVHSQARSVQNRVRPAFDANRRRPDRERRPRQDALSIDLGHAANGRSVLLTHDGPQVAVEFALEPAGGLGRSTSLGYLPMDKHAADLLFQIISQRYQRTQP